MEDCSPQMRATATDDAATWSLRPHTITLRADGIHATLQLDDARQHRVTMASHSADHPPRDITSSPHRGVTLRGPPTARHNALPSPWRHTPRTTHRAT